MKNTIYKTSEGEAEIHAIYNRQLDQLNVPFESHNVKTQFGSTHILSLGRKSGEAIVLLQGGNTTSPLTLNWIKPMMEKYRFYALDTIGHPGKSSPTRLSPRDDSYSRWLVDVMDSFDLQQAILMGGSFGAGILLRTAAYAPDRISKAILLIPSGLVSIPFRTMSQWLWWLMLYKLSPSRMKLNRILQPMFLDEPINQELFNITEAVLKWTKIEAEMPKNITSEELHHFNAPTLVIAAERDALFPAKNVIKRAQEVFPNLVSAEVIPGATHYLSPRFHPILNELCIRFLDMDTA